jgi:hypothetical protein
MLFLKTVDPVVFIEYINKRALIEVVGRIAAM